MAIRLTLNNSRLNFGSGQSRFTTLWRTTESGTSNSDQVTLPLTSTGTYDFTVYV
jgi:hypothetical protein